MIEELESEVDDIEKRIRPIRKYKKLPLSLRSPFWTENEGKIKNISTKEKILSEFAFTVCKEENG